MGRGVDFAIDMIDFTERPVKQIKQDYFCNPWLLSNQAGGDEYILIDEMQTQCFSVRQLKVRGSYIKKADSFYIGVVTKGKGAIKTGNALKSIKQWEKFFIPYNTKEVEYIAEDEMEIVLTFPPK